MRAQSCPTLWDPMDCSLLGSSVHEILQARILEWVAISSSREGLPDPGNEPASPALGSKFFTTELTKKLKILLKKKNYLIVRGSYLSQVRSLVVAWELLVVGCGI